MKVTVPFPVTRPTQDSRLFMNFVISGTGLEAHSRRGRRRISCQGVAELQKYAYYEERWRIQVSNDESHAGS
jgi:hypothetical protein